MQAGKKILLITYYWPPAGGIEVHRIVKFCKYLPEMGYEPIVLTVDGGTATASDTKLMAEVAHVQTVKKARSLEPHNLYYALAGKKPKPGGFKSGPAQEPSGFMRTLGEFVRLNLFIPDARIGWKPAAVKAGDALIREIQPDLILSTAPPYTAHLIASKLAKRHHIPWVADFRDPWVENYAYHTLYRFPWVRWINELMERKVLNAADRVIVATQGQEALQSAKARDGGTRFTTITNGHDFDEIPEPIPSDTFFLSYFGSLSAQRVPVTFFDTIGELIRTVPAFEKDFRFRYAGRITPEARNLIEDRLPESHCEFHSMLPHHEYTELVREHQVLLVLVDQVPNNSLILPAKCFEMITTGNPLLACGPVGGDTDTFLRTHECGTLVAYTDANRMREQLLKLHAQWQNGTLNTGAKESKAFHRKPLTAQLVSVLKAVDPTSPC